MGIGTITCELKLSRVLISLIEVIDETDGLIFWNLVDWGFSREPQGCLLTLVLLFIDVVGNGKI